MFLISLTYLQPIEVVDKYLAEHRAFLDKCYQNNYFVVSGPRNPRTGGIIISNLKDRSQLMEIIKQDPFHKHKIAEFDVIEFEPVKYHHHFSPFIEG